MKWIIVQLKRLVRTLKVVETEWKERKVNSGRGKELLAKVGRGDNVKGTEKGIRRDRIDRVE